MTGAPDFAAPPARLSWRRAAAIILLGPLIGALAAFVLALFTERMWRYDDFFPTIRAVLFLYVAFGWPTGLLPAIGAALLWSQVNAILTGTLSRFFAALLIGAVMGAVLIWPFVLVIFGASDAPYATFAAFGAIGGAVALAATALPWSKS